MDEIHFNHWLPYFDNSSYDIVLNVYLPPASIERIIVIMDSNDRLEDNLVSASDKTTNNPWPDVITTTPVSQDAEIRNAAQMAGMRQAERDISSLDIPENDSELSRRAKTARVVYLKENPRVLEKGHYGPVDLGHLFEKEYIHGYEDQIAITSEDGKKVWPDKVTRTAPKIARTDQDTDYSHRKSLSLKQIRYRAIAHALEHLDLDMVDDIDKFIEL